jgi:hypothetical protein
MTPALYLAAIALACLIALLIAAHFAPVGYEDADGFHAGPSPCERDAQDGRGEGGERGGFLTIHRSADK